MSSHKSLADHSWATVRRRAAPQDETMMSPHTQGPFTNAGERDWNIAFVMLVAILLGMGYLVAVDIWRKCKTGEFQESLKDFGKNVWGMTKAIGHGIVSLPGTMVRAPVHIGHQAMAKRRQYREAVAPKALIDAAQAEAGRARTGEKKAQVDEASKSASNEGARMKDSVFEPHAVSHFTAPPVSAIPSHHSLPPRLMSVFEDLHT